LIYDSGLVPVGRDQKQHLEVARDVAVKFNERFGETFRLPEPQIRDEVATVPGLDGQKMSKSYNNGIFLSDPENVFKKKVMGIKTDSTPVEAPKSVEGSLILQLYSLVAKQAEMDAMKESFLRGGTGYGEYKKELFRALWGYFAEYRARRAEWVADRKRVESVLAAGAAKAREVARATLAKARRASGLT